MPLSNTLTQHTTLALAKFFSFFHKKSGWLLLKSIKQIKIDLIQQKRKRLAIMTELKRADLEKGELPSNWDHHQRAVAAGVAKLHISNSAADSTHSSDSTNNTTSAAAANKFVSFIVIVIVIV